MKMVASCNSPLPARYGGFLLLLVISNLFCHNAVLFCHNAVLCVPRADTIASVVMALNDPANELPADTRIESVGGEFQDLVRRGRAGDNNAVGELLTRFRNYLLLIANQDLDRSLKSKLGASDVVQESLMQAQQNFEQFRGESEAELKGWLKMILVNDIKSNRRQYTTQKRNRELEVGASDSSAVLDAFIDPQLTPASEALKLERARALAAALERLPDDHRTVIELRNFEQLEFTEIGQRMNRSADAARKLWARAVESLLAELATAAPELLSGHFRIETDDERQSREER